MASLQIYSSFTQLHSFHASLFASPTVELTKDGSIFFLFNSISQKWESRSIKCFTSNSPVKPIRQTLASIQSNDTNLIVWKLMTFPNFIKDWSTTLFEDLYNRNSGCRNKRIDYQIFFQSCEALSSLSNICVHFWKVLLQNGQHWAQIELRNIAFRAIVFEWETKAFSADDWKMNIFTILSSQMFCSL